MGEITAEKERKESEVCTARQQTSGGDGGEFRGLDCFLGKHSRVLGRGEALHNAGIMKCATFCVWIQVARRHKHLSAG